MIWSSKFERRWIEAAKVQGLEHRFFNKCVLVARDPSSQIAGFAVFQPRDVQENFAERLLKRRDSMPSDWTFEFIFPEFLSHRVKALFSGEKFQFLKGTSSSFVELRLTASRNECRSKLRVMNVDDSPVLLKFLAHVLGEAPWIEVVGQVSESPKAIEAIRRLKPDLVTMDIQMPVMNGVEVVKSLLAQEHFPILMISSLSLEEGSLVFEALNAGAFDYIQKPKLEERESFREVLMEKLLLAVEGRRAHSALLSMKKSRVSTQKLVAPESYPENLVWCMGSSTGGTQALTRVFTSLPREIPPTLVVQHIPPVFSKAFADSLNALVPFTVKEAENGDILKSNHVYIAPGGKQMSLVRSGSGFQIVVNDDAPVNRFKPSVDYMFLRLAEIKELRFVAGIFTGMGRDGAEGLLALKKAGALTFAQDEASSAVYGMPRAAFELGAADEVLPLDEISQNLLRLSQRHQSRAA